MNDQRQSFSPLCGKVIDSSNDPIIAYDPGARGGHLLFFRVDDLHDLLLSTVAKIVVHQVKEGGWTAQVRRYRASAPLEVLALELVEREPDMTLWETWEPKAQSSSNAWFDEPPDALAVGEACIQHVNRTIKSCFYSRSPKAGLFRLLNLQTYLSYEIDHAARCARLLTERVAAPSPQPLALPERNWVYAAIELSQRGKQDESLDVIFDNIDEMLLRGEFEECDSVLSTMPVNQLSNAQLITVLTATLAAKKELQNRGNFFRQVHSVLESRDSDADLLVRGLE